jgi:hypothetical protein
MLCKYLLSRGLRVCRANQTELRMRLPQPSALRQLLEAGPARPQHQQQRDYKDRFFHQQHRGEDSELRAQQRRQRHSEVKLSHWRLGARDRQSEGVVLPAEKWRVPKPFMSMFISQMT